MSLEIAYKQAFDKVCAVVDRKVFMEQIVIKLSTELEQTPHSNKNYRCSKQLINN